MSGIEMFQADNVAKVAYKPPPPPAQQPEIVKAQDIATTPPAPAEDIKTIETGKGTPSEIAIVPPTVSVPLPPPKDDWLTGPAKPADEPKTEAPPKKKKRNFFDKIGDFLNKHKKEIAIGGAIVGGLILAGGGTGKAEEPKSEPPKTDKPKDPPKTEKPKDPPKTEPKKEEPKPIPASGRTFKTQGDPIVKSGDGLQYSVNTPGTYTSLKAKDGTFNMEQTVRETPGHRHYNTGMSFDFGKTKIAFDTKDGKSPATMKIGNETIELKYTAFNRTLDDGTKISYDPKSNKVNITSPEGDKVTVHRAWNDQKTHYLNAEVVLSEKRPAESVMGVLGTLDADNNAANDARKRDGSVYNSSGFGLWKTPEDFIKEWKVGN